MTLSYRCSNCGLELATTNADPLNKQMEQMEAEIELLRDHNRRLTTGGVARQTIYDAMYDDNKTLRALLLEAMDSRGPDYVEAAHYGWVGRVRDALEQRTNEG